MYSTVTLQSSYSVRIDHGELQEPRLHLSSSINLNHRACALCSDWICGYIGKPYYYCGLGNEKIAPKQKGNGKSSLMLWQYFNSQQKAVDYLSNSENVLNIYLHVEDIFNSNTSCIIYTDLIVRILTSIARLAFQNKKFQVLVICYFMFYISYP